MRSQNAPTTGAAPPLSLRERLLARSLSKSDEQARMGNLPRLVAHRPGQVIWSVGSRTEGGRFYLVAEDAAGELSCDCAAVGPCWHLCHVGRALDGEIGTLQLTRRAM